MPLSAPDQPTIPRPRARPGWWLLMLVTAMVATVALPAAPAVARTEPGYGQADLERDLAAITRAGVTGVQARVITPDGEHLVASSGVADRATKAPVDPQGHYRIASNTKTFVATVVLQLVAEGRLSLEDSVEDHLPGLVTGNGNDGSTVTVRQLLQHTSGIHDYDADVLGGATSPEGFEQIRYRSYDAADLVAIALQHPPDFAPGTRYGYSNTDYVLAGMIVEAVTGNTWEHEVTRRIIKPLELDDTSIPGDDPGLPEPHARGYLQFTADGPLVDVTEFNHTWADAAGAMVSTTADLSRFFRALLAGELLPPAQLEEMQSTIRQAAAAPAGSGMGLGIAKSPLSCGGEFWGHGGDTFGYHSREGFSADGQRSAVLSLTSLPSSREGFAAANQAAYGLVDRALCAEDRT